MSTQQPERDLVRALLLAAGHAGVKLFRNTVGHFVLAQPNCPYCQANGRRLTTGLCVGSSDLVGWRPHVVTQADVGRTVALFVAVEAKTDTGRVSEPQRAFLAALERDGAVAGVARSVADLDEILRLAGDSRRV